HRTPHTPEGAPHATHTPDHARKRATQAVGFAPHIALGTHALAHAAADAFARLAAAALDLAQGLGGALCRLAHGLRLLARRLLALGTGGGSRRAHTLGGLAQVVGGISGMLELALGLLALRAYTQANLHITHGL